MEEVHALGLAKAIGVSNFSCALVMDLLKTCKGRIAFILLQPVEP